MPSKSIHTAANGKFSLFFRLSRIPLYIYLFDLPICWWTFRLLPYPVVNTLLWRLGACIFLNECFCFFSDLYPRVELLGEFKTGIWSPGWACPGSQADSGLMWNGLTGALWDLEVNESARIHVCRGYTLGFGLLFYWLPGFNKVVEKTLIVRTRCLRPLHPKCPAS